MKEIEKTEEEKKLIKVTWFTKDIIKCTNNFRKFKILCISGNYIRTNFINMYAANKEQNHLARYIKEFKSKTKPQHNSNLRKVKGDILSSAMTPFRG